MRLLSTSIIILPFLVHPVSSWSYIGHQLIASIASTHLTPSATSQISTILDGLPLSSIAAWADSIKWQARYKFTSELHYYNDPADHPPSKCSVNWRPPGSQNLITAIHNYSTILSHAERGTWSESESLRFLVHFVEDLHQPLHLSNRERGGNDRVVRFDGYKTNLHKVWDGLGLLHRMRDVYHNTSTALSDVLDFDGVADGELENVPNVGIAELMERYQEHIQDLLQSERFERQVTKWLQCPHTSRSSRFGCPEYWAHDISPLNCEYVWVDVDDGDEVLGKEYWERVVRDQVIEQVVMKAAIRLAAVLNALFEYREELDANAMKVYL